MNDEEFLYACPSEVFYDNSISFHELKLYMVLYSIMDSSGVVYANSEWISNKLGFGVRYTKVCVFSLIEKGYVKFIKVGERHKLKVKDLKVPYKIVASNSTQ